MAIMRILCLGDVVGSTGQAVFQKHIDSIRQKYKIDAVVVNGENSCNGKGITSRIMEFYKHLGVNVVTSGNHIWQNKEIYSYIDQHKDLLRPANFPAGVPGVGYTIFQVEQQSIAVVNLQGRVFMKELVDCPFRTAETILTFLQHKTKNIIVDFHAEATAEKLGLAYFLEGKVTAVVGTHTHVQTADERILPGGTAYITDLGMAGSLNSMIGMVKDPIINHFLYQMPVRFTVDTKTPLVLSGVVISFDPQTGRASAIERIQIIDNDLKIASEES